MRCTGGGGGFAECIRRSPVGVVAEGGEGAGGGDSRDTAEEAEGMVDPETAGTVGGWP